MTAPAPGVYRDRRGVGLIGDDTHVWVTPLFPTGYSAAQYAEKFGPLTPLVPLPTREDLVRAVPDIFPPGLPLTFSDLVDAADAILALLTGQAQYEVQQ